MRTVGIGLAQMNTTVGDITENGFKVVDGLGGPR